MTCVSLDSFLSSLFRKCRAVSNEQVYYSTIILQNSLHLMWVYTIQKTVKYNLFLNVQNILNLHQAPDSWIHIQHQCPLGSLTAKVCIKHSPFVLREEKTTYRFETWGGVNDSLWVNYSFKMPTCNTSSSHLGITKAQHNSSARNCAILVYDHTSFFSDAHKASLFPRVFSQAVKIKIYNSSYWALMRRVQCAVISHNISLLKPEYSAICCIGWL